MRPRTAPVSLRLVLAGSIVLLGLAPASHAAHTQCDTDPNKVLFQATVDPTTLNKLLARLGDRTVRPPNSALTLPGLCVDHQIPISLGAVSLPFGDTTFFVTPTMGSIRVDLTLPGPFEVGVDGGRYRAVNCDSSCVLDVPYLGDIFNGCKIEEAIVRPIVGALNANASWDDIRVIQIADTCVLLGDCTAIHPLESSSVSLTNFDVDLTGFGSCEVCLINIPGIPDIGCFDPCDGIDPLIEGLLEPVLEDTFNNAVVKANGQGILIDVFSLQIRKDMGCVDIPEVKECKAGQPVNEAGVVQGPRDHGLHVVFYSLPLGVAGVLALRRRRRSSSTAPRT